MLNLRPTISILFFSVITMPAFAGPRINANVESVYTLPGSINGTVTTAVGSRVLVGAGYTQVAGPMGQTERYQSVGVKWATLNADVGLSAGMSERNDGWLLRSTIGLVKNGSTEGAQESIVATMVPTYRWMWKSGFNLTTGLGLSHTLRESPKTASKFGKTLPFGQVAAGIAL